MSAAPRTDAEQWSLRAEAAAHTVNAGFGHRLLGIPGTWLASVKSPSRPGPSRHRPRSSLAPWVQWHYWWQAHYLDALVDSAWREKALGQATPELPATKRPAANRGDPFLQSQRLLRAIRLRNFLRLTNSYYDDMAWLALAAGRLDELALDTNKIGLRSARRAKVVLETQLVRAHTNDLGGGIFWSRKRDFKNTPATGPSALYFARNGQPDRAQSLVDWLRSTLFDPKQGLYLDGVHPHPSGPEIEPTIYSYNQGPVLGAMLELGGERNLAHAAELIDAVARHLSTAQTADDGGTLRPLRLHGGGDGGLFTGILVRYLAIAARHPDLAARTRRLAGDLVLDTAEVLWAGRNRDSNPVFSSDIGLPADVTYSAGKMVELSTQLQAWETFEAAFRLTAPGDDAGTGVTD
ncbi:glycosyl hydrolase [Paeniglutamicibacter antarcticus]|uniref:Glycosyl hydrolase n=1 Tax=Arthrobacter terrae TaxID=2935737 RepID=A0A931CUJ5_9MICC|nr:glycoside hydrolase family 76 protein [Arthrobacter terrae]MBG0740123.1 glycosyl hydrolase [Arthrobacter terrae]